MSTKTNKQKTYTKNKQAYKQKQQSSHQLARGYFIFFQLLLVLEMYVTMLHTKTISEEKKKQNNLASILLLILGGS